MRMCKECKASKLATYFRKRGYWKMFDILYGLESRIPICCVLQFAFTSGKGAPAGVLQGCHNYGKDQHQDWVCCNFHKRRHKHMKSNPYLEKESKMYMDMYNKDPNSFGRLR